MKHTAKVIMLPMMDFNVHKGGEGKTSDKLYDCLYISHDGKLKAYGMGITARWGTPYGSMLAGYTPQVLYFATKEEIKQGDWFISDDRNHVSETPIYRVEQCIKIENDWIYGSIDGMGQGHNPDWSLKIVAATDKELYTKNPIDGAEGHFNNKPIALIPKHFVEEYITTFNSREIIEEVELEYEVVHSPSLIGTLKSTVLKLNGNEVIISEPHTEMITLSRARLEGLFYLYETDRDTGMTINDWLKQHL